MYGYVVGSIVCPLGETKVDFNATHKRLNCLWCNALSAQVFESCSVEMYISRENTRRIIQTNCDKRGQMKSRVTGLLRLHNVPPNLWLISSKWILQDSFVLPICFFVILCVWTNIIFSALSVKTKCLFITARCKDSKTAFFDHAVVKWSQY